MKNREFKKMKELRDKIKYIYHGSYAAYNIKTLLIRIAHLRLSASSFSRIRFGIGLPSIITTVTSYPNYHGAYGTAFFPLPKGFLSPSALCLLLILASLSDKATYTAANSASDSLLNLSSTMLMVKSVNCMSWQPGTLGPLQRHLREFVL